MQNKLDIIHDHKMIFDGKCGVYTILGRLSMDLSSLRVTIHLTAVGKRKQRMKLDLYNFTQIQKNCQIISEREDYSYLHLEADLLQLTDQIEAYRDKLFEEEYSLLLPKIPKITKANEKASLAILSRQNLLKTIQRMLGESGIVGEEKNRLLLFLIGLGSRSQYPLHALVHSTSGSGKSHLINAVANCFPQEDLLSLTRVTSKSFYHYRKGELKHKLMLIQDFDGIDEEALYALRELQSYGSLTSSYTHKDKFGNMSSKTQTVEGHFSSFGATTKTIYTDNESRSILLRVDESIEQTKRIINFQNKLSLGQLDAKEMDRAKVELSNMIRLLKDKEVINPYSTKIELPFKAKMLRRLNKQFQDFVCQIAFLHQYQREQTKTGKIIATKSDVAAAIEIFFDSIWLKIDELDGALRDFYERLKAYMLKRDEKLTTTEGSFTQREIRQALNLSKTHCHTQLKRLLSLEYVLQDRKGVQRQGNTYKVVFWDDFTHVRAMIKNNLLAQLKNID